MSRYGRFRGGPGDSSRQTPFTTAASNREPLTRREAAAPERQNSFVDCASFGSAAFAIRAPGGEHLHEPGARGEPRVVVRPAGATNARARQRR
jgi:hypothetical protein